MQTYEAFHLGLLCWSKFAFLSFRYTIGLKAFVHTDMSAVLLNPFKPSILFRDKGKQRKPRSDATERGV